MCWICPGAPSAHSRRMRGPRLRCSPSPPSLGLPCESDIAPPAPGGAGKLGSGQNETSFPLPSWVTISAPRELCGRQFQRPRPGAPAKVELLLPQARALALLSLLHFCLFFFSFSAARSQALQPAELFQPCCGPLGAISVSLEEKIEQLGSRRCPPCRARVFILLVLFQMNKFARQQ